MGLLPKWLQPEQTGDDESSGWVQADYDRAAMDLVSGKVSFLNGVLGDISQDQTDRVRQTIAREREATQALQSKQWRQAINGWLDHAEFCCDKADRYRNERPARDARFSKHSAEYRDRSTRARALIRQNPPT